MNRIAIFVFFLFILITNVRGQSVINVSVKGLENGTKVFLLGEKWKDSVIVHNNRFTFTVPPSPEKSYSLRLNRQYVPGTWRNFYFDHGTLNLTVNGTNLVDITISGPAYAMDFNNYCSWAGNDHFRKLQEFEMKSNKALEKGDTVAALALNRQFKTSDSIHVLQVKQWLTKHPNSPVASFILYNELRNRIDKGELEDQLNSLSKQVSNDRYGLMLANIIETAKITAVGKIAPDFVQNDMAGTPVSLASFKGRYLLLDFWASWCVPCRAENPNLIQAFKKYHSQGFEILGVSLDKDKEKWLQAVKQDKLEWAQVSDLKYWDNEVAKQYDISSVPFNLLLDRSGKIIAKNLRGDQLNRQLEKIFHQQLTFSDEGAAAPKVY